MPAEYRRAKLALSGGAITGEFLDTAVEIADKLSPSIILDLSAEPTPEMYYHPDNRQLLKALQTRTARKVTTLSNDFGTYPDDGQIHRRLDNADILFVSGASANALCHRWSILGIARSIKERVLRGELVLAGVSAGSLMAFQRGLTDSAKYTDVQNWDYELANYLGILPAHGTVHYSEIDELSRVRATRFHQELRNDPRFETGIGIDTDAALISTAGMTRVISLGNRGGITLVRKDQERQELVPYQIPAGSEFPTSSLF
jgi:cyanophycinase-like exopeptidase